MALAAFGFGSVIGAVAVPGLLARLGERTTILMGCAVMVAALFMGMALRSYPGLLGIWAAIGFGGAVALTPAPFALRRHVPAEHHGVAYAALFALANATLLVAYPVAGWLGAEVAPRLRDARRTGCGGEPRHRRRLAQAGHCARGCSTTSVTSWTALTVVSKPLGLFAASRMILPPIRSSPFIMAIIAGEVATAKWPSASVLSLTPLVS